MPRKVDHLSAWTRRGIMALSLGVALLGVSASISNVVAQQSEPPNIAAASDLQFALKEIAASFTKDTGKTVTLTFGSSGNFLSQIQQGAPFQMFMSADEGFIQQLASAGKAEGEGTLYAVGRIVLFAPRGSTLRVDADIADLRAALALRDRQSRACSLRSRRRGSVAVARPVGRHKAQIGPGRERLASRAVCNIRFCSGRHLRLFAGLVAARW